MNDFDDARLRAHLDRRGGAGSPSDTLPAAIHARASSMAQHRSVLAPALGLRRGWLALAAVLSAVALVFASAGFKLPLPAPDGPSSAVTVLSPNQLVQLISESPPESWVDRLVIVDADVEPLPGLVSCVDPCPIGYLSGTERMVAVLPDSDTTFASSGWPVTYTTVDGTIRGPLALRLRNQDAVELIGPLHPGSTPDAVWSLESVVAETDKLAGRGGPAVGPDGVAVGPLFVVDSWLAQSPFAPSCPAPSVDTPSSRLAFRCGPEAWLAPKMVDVEGVGRLATSPPGSVRVQDGAYDSFAPNPERLARNDAPVPRRALYLVRSILESPGDWCPLCSSGMAYIVGRIYPISVPQATPSPNPPSLTVLTTGEFARLLAGTSQAERRDRVVIVDGDIKVSTFSCPLFTAPSCPIGTLDGTEPGLIVWSDSAPAYVDDARAEWDWLQDTIEGPLALRLAASGRVELVGPVETLGPSTVWPLRAVVDEIERLRSFDRWIGPDGIAVGPLFVVDAWLVAPMAPECPAPEASPAPFLAAFACGHVGFLTPEAIQPTTVRVGDTIGIFVPEDSMRVQNWAYDSFAPNPAWSSEYSLAEPRRALFLVRSIVDFPQDSCFMCEAAAQAYVVARIDPIDVLPAGED